MKKYFLHNGANQEGAFDFEELRKKNISKETYIWYEGLSEWTKAGKLVELKDLFIVTPPPFEANASTPPPVKEIQIQQPKSLNEPKKKNRSTLRIISLVVGFILLGGVILNYFASQYLHNRSDNYYENSLESYEEKVMTVEEMERSQPTDFLTADGTYNNNFLGDKIKIHGTITNIATVAKYKDAIIRVTYYSQTKTDLGSDEYTIYDIFAPNSTTSFELKIQKYKNANSVGWEVIDAIPY